MSDTRLNAEIVQAKFIITESDKELDAVSRYLQHAVKKLTNPHKMIIKPEIFISILEKSLEEYGNGRRADEVKQKMQPLVNLLAKQREDDQKTINENLSLETLRVMKGIFSNGNNTLRTFYRPSLNPAILEKLLKELLKHNTKSVDLHAAILRGQPNFVLTETHYEDLCTLICSYSNIFLYNKIKNNKALLSVNSEIGAKNAILATQQEEIKNNDDILDGQKEEIANNKEILEAMYADIQKTEEDFILVQANTKEAVINRINMEREIETLREQIEMRRVELVELSADTVANRDALVKLQKEKDETQADLEKKQGSLFKVCETIDKQKKVYFELSEVLRSKRQDLHNASSQYIEKCIEVEHKKYENNKLTEESSELNAKIDICLQQLRIVMVDEITIKELRDKLDQLRPEQKKVAIEDIKFNAKAILAYLLQGRPLGNKRNIIEKKEIKQQKKKLNADKAFEKIQNERAAEQGKGNRLEDNISAQSAKAALGRLLVPPRRETPKVGKLSENNAYTGILKELGKFKFREPLPAPVTTNATRPPMPGIKK